MKNRGRSIVLSFLIVMSLLREDRGWAGAFLEEASHGKIIVTAETDRSTYAFDEKGHMIPTTSWRRTGINFYGEYGLTEDFTALLASSFYHYKLILPPLLSYNGFERTEIGGRWKIWQSEALILSAQGSFIWPAPQARKWQILTGANHIEIDTKLMGGIKFSLWQWLCFLEAGGGFHRQGIPFPQEGRLDITLGLRPSSSSYLLLFQLFSAMSLNKAKSPWSFRRHKWQSSIVYDLTPQWSVQMGTFITLLSTETRHETGMIAALWYRF